MHPFFLLFLQKILQCWQKCVPIPNFSDHNLAIKKGHPPNLKGVQVKNAKIVFFESVPIRIWLWVATLPPCQILFSLDPPPSLNLLLLNCPPLHSMLLLDSPPSLILLLLDSPSSLFDPPVIDPCPRCLPCRRPSCPWWTTGTQSCQGGRQETHHRGQACPLSSLLPHTRTPEFPLDRRVPALRPQTTAGDYTRLHWP